MAGLCCRTSLGPKARGGISSSSARRREENSPSGVSSGQRTLDGPTQGRPPAHSVGQQVLGTFNPGGQPETGTQEVEGLCPHCSKAQVWERKVVPSVGALHVALSRCGVQYGVRGGLDEKQAEALWIFYGKHREEVKWIVLDVREGGIPQTDQGNRLPEERSFGKAEKKPVPGGEGQESANGVT